MMMTVKAYLALKKTLENSNDEMKLKQSRKEAEDDEEISDG